MSDVVGIVGAGQFGSALAKVVPGKSMLVQPDDDLKPLAEAARLIVLAVPSPRAAAAARALGDVLAGQHVVVHAIGAFHEGRRFSDVLRAETPVKRIGCLAGPALPDDLAARRPTAMVVASPFDEVIGLTRRLLGAPPALRLYANRDLPGVEMASAVAGAMTVGVGIVDGLSLGIGPRSMLVTRAVAEGTRLCGRAFAGFAGLANILVRSASESSPDYQLGLAFGRGVDPIRPETEGSRAAAAAGRIGRSTGQATPILDAVDAIVHKRTPVQEALARLLETSAEDE